MKSTLSFFIVCFLIVTEQACSFDSRYYDQIKATSYTLGYTVIPQTQVQQVTVSSNGNSIAGVFISSPTPNAPTIVYFHGNDKDLDKYWHRLEQLYPLNFNIFIFDFQGYGLSTGSPSLAGIQQNSIDILNYLFTRPDVDRTRLIYYCFSFGGIFGLKLAAETFEPAAFIGEAIPASSDQSVSSVLRVRVPSPFLFDETFDNLSEIQKLKTPILLMAGTADETLPFRDNAALLFDIAPQPKLTIPVQGAYHDQVINTLGEANYRTIIQNFLNTYGVH